MCRSRHCLSVHPCFFCRWVHVHVGTCVCICAYVWKRERERERKKRNEERIVAIHEVCTTKSYIFSCLTVIEVDPNAPFSIATTPRCRRGCYYLSLDCSTLPLIRTLYCWVLSKVVSSTIFKVFGMTRPGIEPQLSHWRKTEMAWSTTYNQHVFLYTVILVTDHAL